MTSADSVWHMICKDCWPHVQEEIKHLHPLDGGPPNDEEENLTCDRCKEPHDIGQLREVYLSETPWEEWRRDHW